MINTNWDQAMFQCITSLVYNVIDKFTMSTLSTLNNGKILCFQHDVNILKIFPDIDSVGVSHIDDKQTHVLVRL